MSNLVDIYRRTKDEFQGGKFGNLQPSKTVKYDFSILPAPWKAEKQIESKESLTQIFCINEDTFTAAEPYAKKGLKTCILNLASDFVPGGGVEKGSRAQEEDLFRRSNLFRTLLRNFYPLKSDQVLYTHTVHVGFDSNYRALDSPFQVSVISCAAIRNPQLYNGRYTQEDYKLMQNKIKMIFEVAKKNGVEILILGALGCGAFHNPPKIVAQIFKQFLNGEYKDVFQEVVFAVLSKNDDNYDIFNKVLG